jgi:UDP-perosamine 4-acetyltransferase
MSTSVIVIGAGGHGRVVADAARAAGFRVLGFTDANPQLHGERIDQIAVLGDDAALSGFDRREVQLLNGIGSVRVPRARRVIHERLRDAGWTLASVVHPRATVAESVVLGDGVQIMAGAVVQAGAQLGAGALINTGAIVDHDCAVGAHSHVAPRAVLSGNVTLGESCHVGTGATIIQGISLGARCVVGAGAVVLRNQPDDMVLIGVPATGRRSA